MAASWRALIDGKPTAAMSAAELLRGHLRGQYGPDAPVRRDEAEEWRALASAFPLAELTPPPLTVPSFEAATDDPVVQSGNWESDKPYAWRRYFARQLDTIIHAFLMFMLLGAVMAANDSAYSALTAFNNPIVLNIVGVMLATVPGAVLIGATGRTIGKLIFGIKVLDAQHRPPGLLRGFVRELQVLLRGLGLGVPLISLITIIGGYNRLMADGRSAWDEEDKLTVWYRKPSGVHALLMVGGILLWVAILVLVAAEGRNAH